MLRFRFVIGEITADMVLHIWEEFGSSESNGINRDRNYVVLIANIYTELKILNSRNNQTQMRLKMVMQIREG